MRRERPKTRRSEGGLTLIEVMIALTILAVGLLSLAAMQLEALRGGRGGQGDTFATTLAQDKMEELRRTAWTSADLTPGGNWSTAQTVTHPESGQVYTLDWRATDVVANWTRAIDVRVRWDAPQRGNRSRVFSSVRFNRDG
jgi:type IV pilus assembly protein PilV